MKLEIPKMLEKIELKDYHPGLGEQTIWVWLNPPRTLAAMIGKFRQKTATPEETYTWFAEIWSQGAEDTRWTAEDVAEMVKQSLDTDPRLWLWLVTRTIELITEHRIKKKVTIS